MLLSLSPKLASQRRSLVDRSLRPDVEVSVPEVADERYARTPSR
jgi:hypothetical protein